MSNGKWHTLSSVSPSLGGLGSPVPPVFHMSKIEENHNMTQESTTHSVFMEATVFKGPVLSLHQGVFQAELAWWNL